MPGCRNDSAIVVSRKKGRGKRMEKAVRMELDVLKVKIRKLRNPLRSWWASVVFRRLRRLLEA